MENERIKNKVEEMLTTIVAEVDPNNIFDLLIERRIVNIEYREKIMNEKTQKDRCRALIYHLLQCSHNETFIVFREALEEHYHWIVERIDAMDGDNENQDDFNIKMEKSDSGIDFGKEIGYILRNSPSVIYESPTEVAVNEDFVPEAQTQTFDDSSMFRVGDRFFIVGMKLHTRKWGPHKVIGAMKVFYNTGRVVVHGSKNPKTAVKDEEFRIGRKEQITEINLQAGDMLDGLTFTTNKGIVYGPYGSGGGVHKRFVCPREGAYLAYITGNVDVSGGATVVRRLRFFWGVPKSLAI